MKLAVSSLISKIDAFCAEDLGISVLELIRRSGEALEKIIRERTKPGAKVLILAGKGNNGADAYAAAINLIGDYEVVIFDIFGEGQKSDEGKYYYNRFLELGGLIIPYAEGEGTEAHLREAATIVDAIFGTGFYGEVPEFLRPLAISVRGAVEAVKIAVDVPLGINADNGSISDFAISVNTSLELSFIKPGMISYPAKAYAGDLVYDSIGLPTEKILEKFDFRYNMIDSAWVAENLPKRENNSHKGTFGKLLVITGSEKYRGAAHLSLEAALRGGAGLVTYAGPQTLISELSAKYPEAIYKNVGNIDGASDETIEELISLSAKHSATLIGSGSSNSERLADLVLALLRSEGGALILDADAINALSDRREVALAALRESKRPVVLTPHPLEFARLSGTDVASVQLHRLEASEKFAKENGVTLILKGAGTVVTDGDEVYINVLGSSALAKAGSGDVLAGLVASLMAQGSASPAVLSSLAVYFHAQAGERLAERLSAYGVTPSDLPLEICKCIASVLN